MSRHLYPPKSSSQPSSPFEKEGKPQLGVSERVSACKGNENNRKVVSFPIIFFKKHKDSVV